MFDVLLAYDGKAYVPILATRVPSRANGDISADGKTITYHLRRGVRWHDGAPFTSADVAFTFGAIVNPKNTALYRAGFDLVQRVETPDAQTVRFIFKQVYAPAIETLFADGPWPYGILPAHLLRDLPTLDNAAFFNAPVGTGPFKFSRWDRGDRIELIRNDDYFLGRPKLTKIVMRIVPDQQTRVALLQSHAVDFIPEIPFDFLDQARHVAGCRIVDVPLNAFEAISFNLERPPLDDRTVRRAITLAIDKQRMTALFAHGGAEPAAGDLPPSVWPGARSLLRPADPAGAGRLLDRSGWTRHGDDVRTRRGAALRVALVYPVSGPLYAKIALQIEDQLRAIGVAVDLRPFARDVYYAPAAAGGVLRKGDFDLALNTWSSGPDPDNSAIFMCRYVPPVGANWPRYCSAAMDAAQHDALSTFDPGQRARAYARIEALAVHDAPYVFYWWRHFEHVVNTDLRDFAPSLANDMWNAYQWDI